MTDTSSYIGKEIGNYRIVAELKSGSFGSVFQGKHVIFEDDPIVAIKLLHADLSSPQEHNHFIQEARLLKKLRHPHILPIFDAGIHNDVPYLVMEYISRGTLRDRLNQQSGQPLAIEEALTILAQIGQALHYAHQQEIVHCDLKPENILINDKGEAILADFGIATVLTAAKTRQIGLEGTPAYMAPEQFEGIISMKSDQYALGCIAYELMAGRKPFMVPYPSIEAMLYQHAKVDPIPPTHLNPRIPIHIEQAIMKALAKQRTDRHADVSTFTSSFQKPFTYWLQESSTLYALKGHEETSTAYAQVDHFTTQDAIINLHWPPKNISKTVDTVDTVAQKYSQVSRHTTNEQNTTEIPPLSWNKDKSFIKLLNNPSNDLVFLLIGLILFVIASSFALFSFIESTPKTIPKDHITSTSQAGISASPVMTNTPLSTPSPTATSTAAPDANFSWCTSQCTSNGFIVEYPNGWNQGQTTDKMGVEFLNPAQQDQYAAFKVPVAQVNTNASTLVDNDLQSGFSAQPGYIAPTSKSVTTIGGETWTYAIAYYQLHNQKERVEVFATIHSGKGYVIELQAADSQFDAVDTQYFATMIGRFQFQTS